MITIDRISIGVIQNETIDQPIDDFEWGFSTKPDFKNEGAELAIIFDLLIPINDNQHIYTKSGSRYLLRQMTQVDYVRNVDVLLDLIQASMEHTRRIFKQRNPDHAHIKIPYFDKKYFLEELQSQFEEQGLN